ncbi:hypothetical protein BGZ97_011250 [Linnemannia gamsii]|uniref:Uncharacterized protein n=1 Tax=Linnemannia gamsii TaxID=64522 RepID=A0A9P6UNE9_9FUNG|nr:hypothetical protein BGZ97_011250 [Linnemannia gamsii]
MPSPTKFDKVILADHLEEIERLEEEEAHWKQFLYLPETTLRYYKKPIFVTQDINHDQDVARRQLYETRLSIVRLLARVQQWLFQFKTDDPTFVHHHRRSMTEVCLNKMKFLENESLAYVDDQFSWGMPKKLVMAEEGGKYLNWEALKRNQELTTIYRAIYNDLLAC